MANLNPTAWQVACCLGDYTWDTLPLHMLPNMPYQAFNLLRTNVLSIQIAGGAAHITITRHYAPEKGNCVERVERLFQRLFQGRPPQLPSSYLIKFTGGPKYQAIFGGTREVKTWLECRTCIEEAYNLGKQVEEDLKPLVEALEELVEEKRRGQGT